MILFFDTETTGLPNGKLSPSDPKQPAILQLAAILSTSDGEILRSMSTLVQPGSKPVHPKAFEAHGITSQKANTEGITQLEAFNQFSALVDEAESMAAHNYDFDFNLIKIMAHTLHSETGDDDLLLNFDDMHELPFYCTMKRTIDLCRLPFPSGRKGYKYPKLQELYWFLFQEELVGSHDALTDVKATHRCFFELKQRGIF